MHCRRFVGEIPKGCVVEFTRAQLRKPNNHERKKRMHENLEKVKLLARDLRDGKEFPRSPRATLGGYVLAARAVDNAAPCLWTNKASIIPIARSISAG